MRTNDIERLLQKAPQPVVPDGLVRSLKADIRLPAGSVHREVRESSAWLRRWIPALGFAVWFFGCLIVLGVQTNRIAELKTQTQARVAAALEAQEKAKDDAHRLAIAAAALKEQLLKDVADAARLRTEVDRLRAELAELPKVQTENSQLRLALNTQTPVVLKPEDDFFAAQNERVMRVKCIGHLKQVGLAARMWANDSKTDAMPRDVESLKRYLNGTEVLFCPSDGKTPYQILSPGASEAHPQTVFARCQIHYNVVLCDGSGQQLSSEHKLVQRDGEWVITK